LSARASIGQHGGMSASDPPAGSGGELPRKRRNPWIWVSALLAVVAIGLLIWALKTKSDLDSTQQDVKDLQAQVEKGQQSGSSFATAAKGAIQSLAQQVGATGEDLAAAQQDISNAKQTAEQAKADAEAAKQSAADAANNATEKAKAEADQAKADAQAAQSRAAIAGDCAKAYLSAIGSLFEGDNVRAQAAQVREQLKGITGDCQAALGGT
jgi:cytoskeletal protein RodZ